MKRLKEKWGIESNLQFAIIMIVFALTGSASVWVAKPILAYFSIEKGSMNPWLYYPLRILIVFPAYQVMLLVIGALFGQFKFFLEFEKKMLGRGRKAKDVG